MPIRVTRFIKDLWLNVEQIQEKGLEGEVLTVSKVYTRKVGNEERIVLAFATVERHLPLNQTNTRAMFEGCGAVDDALEWVGAKVQLSVETTLFQNQETQGVRLYVVEFTPKPKGGAK